MTTDEVKEEEEMVEEGPEEVVQGNVTMLSLKLLPLTKTLQAKHGLRHGDYQRYRGYCSRRLARLRKVLNIVQGDRKKFVRKDVTAEVIEKASMSPEVAAEAKHLQVPLMSAERAWSYAIQLKFEMNSEPRKRFHMINRLRKAKVHADQLEKLCLASELVDARSKLESQAYALWLSGLLAFELNNWSEAMAALTAAKSIYGKLASTLNEDEAAVYAARMDEIAPSLRYCAYNIGDASAKDDLLKMRGQHVEELISQAREHQASTLQDVEWRGRKMAVKQEKVRVFLLRNQEFNESEVRGTPDEKIAAYESLLADSKDAIQALRDDLIEDPAFRNRQQTNEGPVTPMHFLYTYLTFIKCSKTIERNLIMIGQMKKVLSGEVVPEKGRKPVKAQDLVRLYETVIQNFGEMPQMAGLEDDLAFRQETEAKIGLYKAHRCYYIALTYMNGEKWDEARALFQRATVYAARAKNDAVLGGEMRAEMAALLDNIEGRMFITHANSILETETAGSKAVDGAKAGKAAAEVPLIDRLDVYHEDACLAAGKANLVKFPPSFQPIPCKPLFFDLAREQLAFPDLEDRVAPPGGGQSKQQGSGWLGGWLGWGKK